MDDMKELLSTDKAEENKIISGPWMSLIYY